MVIVFCDRCEAKIGPKPASGSMFTVPVFSERSGHLEGAVETHLCTPCAHELVQHLINWWGKVVDWQKAWNETSKTPPDA